MTNPRSGADILADTLAEFGVRVVTHVPGEGILEILDALASRAPQIRLASFRHEAGMAFAAQAIGQLSGTPGICLAARAPGALNTCLALHTADTDSAPMILIIGQAPTETAEREAFLGNEFHAAFGPLAKWVAQIPDAARIPEFLSRAWHTAISGKPGPVVLVLPEDVSLQQKVAPSLCAPRRAVASVDMADAHAIAEALSRSERPMVWVGGTGWTSQGIGDLVKVAERYQVPVVTSYRRRDLMDNGHSHFGGEVGIGIAAPLARRFEAADLVLVLGARTGELNTFGANVFKGFSLLRPPKPACKLIHVHPGEGELNNAYQADLAICARPEAVLAALVLIADERRGRDVPCTDTPDATEIARSTWVASTRREREQFVATGECPGPVDLRAVYAHLRERLPDETVVTSGAGAYAMWPQRYFPHRLPNTQLGPKSGAMGYGLAAAIGAALQGSCDRPVAIAGDGCFLMHGEELESAVRLGLRLLVLVANNRAYGAIRASQQRMFGREVGTRLGSVDFVAYATSFGAMAWRVTATDEFAPALDAALSHDGVSLIELVLPDTLTKPVQS
ncbi:thiamine pyrophosphate-dependent enzyme [Pandoraea fibrosis]|uniref:Putative acetolactate synthase large subunit n=1 Tax=Pandoraea fibrosis TaxID=1891094 RepID=A0A5E4VFP1_9BURK|nr:thiamine pyrophosphate-dependent enzyme [Pandoraea fibrosis]VVE11108.1 putative acetolactate synthase large subunit [Pandoraea fibrosis]